MKGFQRLLKETALYGIGGIASRVLNFLLVPYYTAQLIPADYGVVIEIYAMIAVIGSVLSFGMETSFFRFVQRTSREKALHNTYLILLTLSLSAWVAGGLSIPHIAPAMGFENHVEYLYWGLLIVTVDTLTIVPLARLRHEGKALRYIAVKLSNILCFAGLNILLLSVLPIEGEAPGYILIANLCASVFTAILLFKQTPKPWRTQLFDQKLHREMIRYALPIAIAGVAAIAHQTADKFFLKYLLPEGQRLHGLGVYGACAKLAVIIALFTQAFRLAAEPFFFAQAKGKHAKDRYAQPMHYWVMLLGFVYVVICANLSWIKWFIPNPQYWEGLDIVPILLLSNVFLAIYVNLSLWYKVSGKTQYGAYLSLGGVVVSFVGNFLLIKPLGYTGAAWATLLTYGAMMIASYLLNQRKYPIPYRRKPFLIYLSGAIVLGWLGRVCFPDHWLAMIGLPMAFALLVYFGEVVLPFPKKHL